MDKLTCQIDMSKLSPYSQEDVAVLSNYRQNQVVRVKVYGTTKERSLQQLRLYFACCNKVAENMDDPQWNTKDKVDFSCRVGLHFVDPKVTAVAPDGTVTFKYRSISFKNLKHIEACNYFDRAFEFMAKKIGVIAEKLTIYANI